MALVAPVMQVIEEVSQPLKKDPLPGSTAAGTSPMEKGIPESDSEKLDQIANMILERLRFMIDTDMDRRGY